MSKFIHKLSRIITTDPNIINEAALADIESSTAPAVPQTTPKTPSKPKERPKDNPFNPPRPAADPAPKACSLLKEAFEDEAHKSTVDFWKNIRKNNHPFSKHPILSMYGYESASKSFDNTAAQIKKYMPDAVNIQSAASQILMKIENIERKYRPQLEQLAVKAVSEVWGIDQDRLHAQLTRNTHIGDYDDDGDEGNELDNTNDDIEDIRDHINKRITMNALTQGAAVHNMSTLHNIVLKELSSISPELVELYNKFNAGAVHMYWIINFAQFLSNLKNMAIGTCKVKFEDNGQPAVEAKAMVFPVLLQELVKGVMEILSAHGLKDHDTQTLKRIYKHSDKLEDEPWLIQVGPHLWRTFLKIVPKGKLVNVVAELASKEPKYVHDLLSKTIEAIHSGNDPVEAREAINDMMEEIEEDFDIDV